MSLVCRRCGRAVEVGEALRVTPSDPSERPFLIHRPDRNYRCFRWGVPGASRAKVELLDAEAARALDRRLMAAAA